ncbi:Holliday junction branch migration protein RuvA [Octadecabacter sp. 1_MG-2023]|uniref:Holliday junction branch migration protein RuvA n=1 Tax=unclassified Octadecabacter TaxID=196158 RepID=UPI001C083DBA|nr:MULTISPECIES: Holliday junction branch migration protein RuvA [unclassified Octadecabacter]MBU2991969.1 Holliday junction branch migration protein RuvA [Octadecabacter sp. B2R22]MDO6735943.1 Holliday junction branch migration protein RuvA [Octadecabacter sp. 1_MG-2023]
MIGRIAGRLEYRTADHVLIDVKGVGYIVFISERVMATLPANGEAVALYTDLLVREDLLQLFGFSTLVEKEWHRLLMSVQGIGAKASMAILGGLGADGVSRAIALGDWAAVATAKGVGPKTAKKVILELKDKAHAVMAMAGTGAAPAAGGRASPTADAADDAVLEPMSGSIATDGAAQSDALSALGNLGYGPSDAASAVAQAAGENEGANAEVLIRAALKLLAPKG